MNIFKNIAGNILYLIAKITSIVLDGLITLIEFMVSVVLSIAKGLVALISMGGCLLIILLSGPLGIALLMNPIMIGLILSLIILPILGIKFMSYLKYLKYMVTEYLFDRAEYLRKGKAKEFKSFNEYGHKYIRMEEEKRRKEQQRRQEEQQRMWEERFKQWNQYQNKQNWGYGGYQEYSSRGGYTHVNPTGEFKAKYEKSCDLLGVKYDADKYEIKLAYRQKAKQYHPDINKAPDATKKFQEINEAYEFLGDNNIERYKSI